MDEFDEISVSEDSDEAENRPNQHQAKPLKVRTPLKEILKNKFVTFKRNHTSPTYKKCRGIVREAFKNDLTIFSFNHPFYEAFMLHRTIFIDALSDYIKKHPINHSEQKKLVLQTAIKSIETTESELLEYLQNAMKTYRH